MSVDFAAFKQVRIELKRPLLMLVGGKGILACGYLNPVTFDKTGEAIAIVSGVNDFDDMRTTAISAVSAAAAALGVTPGMTGEEALARFA
ncbi:hypothetical protein CEG14_11215 [Bordetella genomosp. 1]|uniref:DUF1805 domain-containing protein n=1 Tax=Bordetella genomosp. 1 TaxID=1395607 RepID=A0A261SDZ3_9BORD|nr:DUF1805 domain-containing protein [Bordetella genomosp. 1]MDQ8034177.1 DUF1805 domain-containing protein [Bordetella sp.]OZI35628.1 hypothetical protein CEG14_11215 [Bordetella genomosp. 1]OZI64155.1 hypothetical protein CAL27_16420 [Bordetella genomosp. 1]